MARIKEATLSKEMALTGWFSFAMIYAKVCKGMYLCVAV
jgi:hypothetical protein